MYIYVIVLSLSFSLNSEQSIEQSKAKADQKVVSKDSDKVLLYCLTTVLRVWVWKTHLGSYTGPAAFIEQHTADIVTGVKSEIPIPGSDDLWHQYRPLLLPTIPPGSHLSSHQTPIAEPESPTHCPLWVQTLHLERDNTKCVTVVSVLQSV